MLWCYTGKHLVTTWCSGVTLPKAHHVIAPDSSGTQGSNAHTTARHTMSFRLFLFSGTQGSDANTTAGRHPGLTKVGRRSPPTVAEATESTAAADAADTNESVSASASCRNPLIPTGWFSKCHDALSWRSNEIQNKIECHIKLWMCPC